MPILRAWLDAGIHFAWGTHLEGMPLTLSQGIGTQRTGTLRCWFGDASDHYLKTVESPSLIDTVRGEVATPLSAEDSRGITRITAASSRVLRR